MWWSRFCLIQINRNFLHSALIFPSSCLFKSQLCFPPTNGSPEGSGWTATWKLAMALPRNILASAEECPFPGASLRQTALCSQKQDWNPVTLIPYEVLQNSQQINSFSAVSMLRFCPSPISAMPRINKKEVFSSHSSHLCTLVAWLFPLDFAAGFSTALPALGGVT